MRAVVGMITSGVRMLWVEVENSYVVASTRGKSCKYSSAWVYSWNLKTDIGIPLFVSRLPYNLPPLLSKVAFIEQTHVAIRKAGGGYMRSVRIRHSLSYRVWVQYLKKSLSRRSRLNLRYCHR